MASRKFLYSLMMLSLLFAFGCQPAPSRSSTAAIGIGRLGPGNAAQRNLGTNKQWGVITNSNGDQAFWQELYYFTYPQVGDNGDAVVGYVSSQPNQSTGVFFNGNAQTVGGSIFSSINAYLNLTNVQLEIDIYDDKVSQYGPISHPYTNGSGSVQGGYITLNFQDTTSLVTMNGTIQGQMFNGQIYYSNSSTGGQSRQLGSFTVPVCGFFVCQ